MARLATKHRRRSPLASLPNFSIHRFIQEELPQIVGAPVTVERKDLFGTPDYPAYVPAGSLTLVCDDEVWAHAGLGDGNACYVLAHECGHLVLHSGYELHFSDPTNKFGKWYIEEQSTEWQAHAYARPLLLPDFILSQYSSVKEVLEFCNVPSWLAERRYREFQRIKYTGDSCATCGNFTLIRTGNLSKCATCSKIVECC